jgi:diguanylate cyclase (GGDEF)-like protein
MDALELALLRLDKSGLIIEQNSTSRAWFGEVVNTKYREFCTKILQENCKIDSVEVVANNLKRYKIASFELESDTIVVFKELASVDYLNLNQPFDSNYVLSREEFIASTKNIIYEADIIHSKVALLFIEIANLDNITDTYSKKSANSILNIVSRRLRNSLRESDLIGKFDYNKFAVAINGIERADIPKKISKKIIHSISRPIITEDGHKILIDILVGVSIYPDDSQNIDELISQADLKRYSLKLKSKRWLLSFV